MRRALEKLNDKSNSDCLNALGGADALTKLFDATWQFGALDPPSITGNTASVLGAQVVRTSVTLNSLIGFESPTGFVTTTTASGGISSTHWMGMLVPSSVTTNIDDIRAIIILHELGHMTGKLPADGPGAPAGTPADQSARNTKTVTDACFKKKEE